MEPYWTAQGDEKDTVRKDQMIAKLTKVRLRRYVGPGVVTSLTHFFGVDKGQDIRMVYDGSCGGLNKSIWMPRFLLPTI